MKMKKKELLAIATLNHWGVSLLSSPVSVNQGQFIELPDLIKCLIQSDSPRLKLGITAFFLVRPDKASVILQVVPLLKKNTRHLLQYYYMSAVYLQRLWHSQLFLGKDLLPDYFSEELGLPDPSFHHGRVGLAYVEEALQKCVKQPYNYKASFESLIEIIKSTGVFSHETAC